MAPQTLVNVTLPEMGESVSEGSIVEWRKKIGDWVDEGDTLVDVTTDKVDVEVPSTASGVVTARHGDEGATIPVGAVLVEIDTTAAKPEGAAASSPGESSPAAGSPTPTAPNVTLSLSKGAPQDPTLVTPASYGAPGSGAPRRSATAATANRAASCRTTRAGWSSASTSTPRSSPAPAPTA